jgi:hypothetical protein
VLRRERAGRKRTGTAEWAVQGCHGTAQGRRKTLRGAASEVQERAIQRPCPGIRQLFAATAMSSRG